MPADFGQVEGICDEFASAGVRFEGKVGLNCGQRGEAKVQRQIESCPCLVSTHLLVLELCHKVRAASKK